MAMAVCPTDNVSLSPSGISFRSSGGDSMSSTARSESGSVPSTVASYSDPSAKTTATRSADSTTCSFVTMWPSALQTKPDPSDGTNGS